MIAVVYIHYLLDTKCQVNRLYIAAASYNQRQRFCERKLRSAVQAHNHKKILKRICNMLTAATYLAYCFGLVIKSKKNLEFL